MDVSISLNTVASTLGFGLDKAAQVMAQIGFDGVDFQFCAQGRKELIGTPESEATSSFIIH